MKSYFQQDDIDYVDNLESAIDAVSDTVTKEVKAKPTKAAVVFIADAINTPQDQNGLYYISNNVLRTIIIQKSFNGLIFLFTLALYRALPHLQRLRKANTHLMAVRMTSNAKTDELAKMVSDSGEVMDADVTNIIDNIVHSSYPKGMYDYQHYDRLKRFLTACVIIFEYPVLLKISLHCL